MRVPCPNASALPAADALGFVFQDFQLFGDLTARENASFGRNTRATVTPTGWTRVRTIGHRRTRTPVPRDAERGRETAGRYRTSACKPSRMILADEPTGQLDPNTAESVLDLLFSMKASTETALVVISHDRS